MKLHKILFVLTAILLLVSNLAVAQKNIDYDQLDRYIQKAVDDFEVPGLSVGIVKNGNVVFKKGYGVKSTDTNEPVDTKTLFGIASLSKAFTAASIAMLVDEGKIDWEDRVIDHLPWFRLYDPYITNELRINDLLCHRVGLATFDGDLLWYGTDYSRKEIVERIGELPIKNSFRSKYGYQNVMFITAGEIIESVTGTTWDQFIEERIFNPLEMNFSTTTNTKFTQDDNVAVPHLEGVPQEFINYDNSGPAASINSCVDDMLKWAQLWLNKGKLGEEQLFSEKSYYTITKSYTTLNAGPGEKIGGTHFVNAGLGWFLTDYSGRKILSHGGGLSGYLSRIYLVPEDSLGIVVFENDMKPVYRDVAKKILDLFLNDNDIDYVARSFERIEKREEKEEEKKKKRVESRVAGTKLSLAIEDYAGIYEDKMYGMAEILFENNKLTLTLLPTKELFTGTLEHWHYDTFNIKLNDPYLPEGFVTFYLDPKGEITNFTIELPNPDFHFHNLDFRIVKQ